jgi:1,4-dihydroxy-6-naphthoate synthase
LAFSPCPNDTFIFHALASGRLSLEGRELRISLHDVETLNRAALKGTFDITKLSFHAYLHVRDQYHLLQTGAALGYGFGPLLVSSKPLSQDDLPSCRIAVPGDLTTAHLLLRLYCPRAEQKVFVRYDDIIPEVASGRADCGVIIHEDRFVYRERGLVKIVDLGEWWEQETGAPVPLGCVAMRRSLASDLADAFDDTVRESIRLAREAPDTALPFIRAHAQEMDRRVLEQHIATFVNDFSANLGAAGIAAVRALEEMARGAGVIP